MCKISIKTFCKEIPSGSIQWIASISADCSPDLFMFSVLSGCLFFFSSFPTKDWRRNIGQLLREQFDTWHKPCASLAQVPLCLLAFLFACTVIHIFFYYSSISSWQRLAEPPTTTTTTNSNTLSAPVVSVCTGLIVRDAWLDSTEPNTASQAG